MRTADGRLPTCIRMDEQGRRLDPEAFVRLHRSRAVNPAFVASMGAQASSRLPVTLKDGRTPFASRDPYRALHRQVV